MTRKIFVRRATISRSNKCRTIGGEYGRGFSAIGSMEVPDHKERPSIFVELEGRPQGYNFSRSGGNESEGAIITTVYMVPLKLNFRPMNWFVSRDRGEWGHSLAGVGLRRRAFGAVEARCMSKRIAARISVVVKKV